MKKALIFICLFFIIVFNVTSFAQTDDNVIVMRVGGGQAATIDFESPQTSASEVFKTFVEQRTGGRVQVNFYPMHQLGGERERLESTIMGDLEATWSTEGPIASIFPEIQVISIPFLFSSDLVAWEFFDNSKVWSNIVENLREKTGLRTLCTSHLGYRHFSNSVKEIRKPEDMKGMKIRVMESPVYTKLITSLKALPTAMPGSEVYTALQQKIVDGYEQPTFNMIGFKFYEVSKYVTLDGHIYGTVNLYINDDFYNSLPQDIQKIVDQGAKLANYVVRGISSVAEYAIAIKFLEENGVKIYTPSAEELDMFRDATQEPIIEWLKTQMDAGIVEEVLAEVSAIEEKY